MWENCHVTFKSGFQSIDFGKTAKYLGTWLNGCRQGLSCCAICLYDAAQFIHAFIHAGANGFMPYFAAPRQVTLVEDYIEANWNAPLLIEEIAAITACSARMIFLIAQRGPSGSYRLTSTPIVISIATIVEAMDGPIFLTNCVKVSHKKCKFESTCHLSGRWDPINAALYHTLESVSLASMAMPSNR